jgi:hypothetical protein
MLEPETLQCCLEVMAEHPDIGALSPLLLDGKGRRWRYPERCPSLASLALGARCGASSPAANNLEQVDWLPGACLFLRRTALGDVGLLDERFFLYKEDVDLCLRLRRAGYPVVRFLAPRSAPDRLCARLNPGRDADRARGGFGALALRESTAAGHWRVLWSFSRIGLAARMAKAVFLRLLSSDPRRRESSWMVPLVEIDRRAA